MKQFIFLYPASVIINWEVKNHGWDPITGLEEHRDNYERVHNQCIDSRYRQQGFAINWATLNGERISKLVHVKKRRQNH
jgi:hypothetical protein